RHGEAGERGDADAGGDHGEDAVVVVGAGGEAGADARGARRVVDDVTGRAALHGGIEQRHVRQLPHGDGGEVAQRMIDGQDEHVGVIAQVVPGDVGSAHRLGRPGFAHDVDVD